jgi:hypothetical protein
MQSTKQIIINGQGSGSAFYLGNSVWATAKHCVMSMQGDGMFYHITMDDVPCRILSASVEHDVALFMVDTPKHIKPFRLNLLIIGQNWRI